MNFTRSQIKKKLNRFLKKNRSGPDLTEPGRQAMGRPRSNAARWERPIRMADWRARPVSDVGGRSCTGRRAPFDQVKIDDLGLSSSRQMV
jgi:hypothetical protein